MILIRAKKRGAWRHNRVKTLEQEAADADDLTKKNEVSQPFIDLEIQMKTSNLRKSEFQRVTNQSRTVNSNLIIPLFN